MNSRSTIEQNEETLQREAVEAIAALMDTFSTEKTAAIAVSWLLERSIIRAADFPHRHHMRAWLQDIFVGELEKFEKTLAG